MEIPALLLSSLERAPWGWGVFVTLIIALAKYRQPLQLQVLKARSELQMIKSGEKRTDLLNCRERIDEMDRDLKAAIAKMHEVEMKLVGTATAYRILDTELESIAPDSTALAAARAVFRDIWDITHISLPPDMLATLARAN